MGAWIVDRGYRFKPPFGGGRSHQQAIGFLYDAATKNWPGIIDTIGGWFRKKRQPFTGEINLETGRVDVCGAQPGWCNAFPQIAKRINDELSSFLAGTGPPPGGKRWTYLVSEIERVNPMRIFPATGVMNQARGQSTPALQALYAMTSGRGPRPRRARKSSKRRSARSSTRSRRTKKRPARLVKGSKAAKRYMASIRRKRR